MSESKAFQRQAHYCLKCHTLAEAQAAATRPPYLSAAGDVGGRVVHVPITCPKAKPSFLGSKPQLQQTVNFGWIDI